MFPNVEVRHLHAVIALGEELNFTQAAVRLNLTQPALSKQITDIEKQLDFICSLATSDGLLGAHGCWASFRRRSPFCALAYGAGRAFRSCRT